MKLTIEKLNDTHLSDLWYILKEHDDYFSDRLKKEVGSLNTFKNYFAEMKGLVGKIGDDLIICAYISYIHDGFGEINIFTKRKSITHDELIQVIKDNIGYFFEEFKLKMIYAITRLDNKACIRLMRDVGLKATTFLKDYEIVNGNGVDCVMSVMLKGEA